MTTPPQKWITPFFFCAAVSALAAVVMVLLLHDAKRPDIGGHAVADITVNLGGQPVTEHCTTCHPNGSRPDPANLSRATNPHPDITPHRIDKLGCTGCHLGEGMALDLEISHGLPGLGARQVLQGKDLQAACFRCHKPGPLPGAEKAWNGYQLFFAYACSTCHAISSVDPSGFFGPDLSRIGSVLGLDAIQEAIREPRKEPANSSMPRFPLSRGQSRQISFYLKSLTGDSFFATPMQMQSGRVRTPEPDLRPLGVRLSAGESALHEKQCLACHRFGEVDGRIAPDLTYIGAQRDSDYLKTFLNSPTRLIPGAAMPRIPMDPATENSLLQFLLSEALGPVSSHTPIRGKPERHREPESRTAGAKQLYMRLCQRCHAAGGDGRGPIQPNLASFPRAFTNNADFFRAVSDERLRESLRRGIPGTSMPGYGKLLGEDQIDPLLDLIFTAFINLDRQEKIIQSVLPMPPDTLTMSPKGEDLYVANCQRCHGVAGTGTGPDSIDLLPRPRNLRNQPYFQAISDSRIARAIHDGIPGTAMPAFGEHLVDRDLWSLVEKVREFSRRQD